MNIISGSQIRSTALLNYRAELFTMQKSKAILYLLQTVQAECMAIIVDTRVTVLLGLRVTWCLADVCVLQEEQAKGAVKVGRLLYEETVLTVW